MVMDLMMRRRRERLQLHYSNISEQKQLKHYRCSLAAFCSVSPQQPSSLVSISGQITFIFILFFHFNFLLNSSHHCHFHSSLVAISGKITFAFTLALTFTFTFIYFYHLHFTYTFTFSFFAFILTSHFQMKSLHFCVT